MKTTMSLEEENQALAEIYAEFPVQQYTDEELDEMARLDEIRNRNHNTPHEL